MKIRFAVVAVALGLMLACDSDGDGLSNSEEEELGLDPKNEDSDGDGLSDGDEISWGADPLVADTDGDMLTDGDEILYGTDPVVADTDGDSYLDGWEVIEGTDPLDRGDKIYKGKWPYDPNKSGNTSVGDPLGAGAKIGRLKSDDQFGERVDFYDFGGDHQSYDYIIVDLSAEWCGPCHATSEWLSTGSDTMGFEGPYGDVRKAVDDGKVMWVTVLGQDNYGGDTTSDVCHNWDEMYPHKKVPVMADPGQLMLESIVGVTGFFPSAAVIKAKNMKVEVVGGVDDALSFVQGTL